MSDAGGHNGRGITTVEGIVTTVKTVGHGRADHGGGGEKRSLHDEKDKVSHRKE